MAIRRRTTLLVVAVLLFAAVSATITPAAARASAPAVCTDVDFIGLRGSGEVEELDMGPTVRAVYESFRSQAQAEGRTVRGSGLDEIAFPAIPVLPESGGPSLVGDWVTARAQPSVLTGSESLGARLRPYLESNPSTCVVLAGYSQGAWAIGGILMTNGGYVDPVLARVSGVVLLGDPAFDPGSSVARGDREAAGILRASFHGVPLPGAGRYYDGLDAVRSYCSNGDPVCGFRGLDHPDLLDCVRGLRNICGHHDYVGNGYTGAAAEFLLERIRSGGPVATAPRIEEADTYREGELVFVRVRHTGPATGFGFRGSNGAGWAEESHPFADPSYGRIGPGHVDYPFNLGCGGTQQYESDIEFWVYGDAGSSAPVAVHLRC